MKTRTILLILVIVAFSQACDKIESPYLKATGSTDTTTTIVKKTVLIESYTGHDCPNCPEGTAAVKDMLASFPGQIVVMAIHAPFFGRPTPLLPEDFRTTEGNQLAVFFKAENEGLPKALANRTGYLNNTHRLGPSEIAGRVIEELGNEPILGIKLSKNYNSADRSGELNVQISILEQLQRRLFLSVFITEDSIVSPQKNKTQIIQDYVHMYMLRGSVNGTWGDEINAGATLNPGATINKNYTFNLNPAWKDEHCAIVAFVYDGDTYEVLQAARAKIK